MIDTYRTMMIAGAWMFYGIFTCQTNDWGLLVAWVGLFSILVMRGDIK